MYHGHGTFFQRCTHLLNLILAGWAMSVSLIVRRNSGKGHLATWPLGAAVLACYILLMPCPELVFLFLFFAYAGLLHIACLIKLRFKGVVQHTRYSGEPWLARLFCKNERLGKLLVEPLLTLALGCVIIPYACACGIYFLVASYAMAIVQRQIDIELQRRLDEMHNGRIDNAQLMQEFHSHYQKQRRR
jgi:hypothetical protein